MITALSIVNSIVARSPSAESKIPSLDKMSESERESFLSIVVDLPVTDTHVFYAQRDRTWDITGKIKRKDGSTSYVGLFLFSSNTESSTDPVGPFEAHSELVPGEKIDVQAGIGSRSYRAGDTFHGFLDMIASNILIKDTTTVIDLAKSIRKDPKCAKTIESLMR